MPSFKKTLKQREASKLIKSSAKHIMLYGGSRSGKTFLLVYAIFVRALRCKSRHVILRLNFNHAKTSLWLDTIPKVLTICFPGMPVNKSKTDYYITLHNGSEVWVAGLDDDKRVEKILGKEYSTIYFNECSQIPYKSVNVASTRLAEKSPLTKKIYYDENPPNRKHWSYYLFVKNIDPIESTPLPPSQYAAMLINPVDNLANIDSDYLSILEAMPEKMKQRFMMGEFVDDYDGIVYYEFKRDKVVKELLGNKSASVLIGMDFNVNPMTCVIAQVVNDKLHILDEVFIENSDTPKMCSELVRMGYAGSTIYPDSTGANRKTSGRSDHVILKDDGFKIQSTRNPLVFDRVNNINYLLKAGRIVIDPKCKKLINDLEKVSWRGQDLDQKTDPLLTHISDALGYLAWGCMNVFRTESKPIVIS